MVRAEPQTPLALVDGDVLPIAGVRAFVRLESGSFRALWLGACCFAQLAWAQSAPVVKGLPAAQQTQAAAFYVSAKRAPAEAVVLLTRCANAVPNYYPCQLELGDALALRAVRQRSQVDMDASREAYRRFVALAPSEHAELPRVKDVLSRPAPALSGPFVTVAGLSQPQLEQANQRANTGADLSAHKRDREAMQELERCVTDAPTFHPCWRLLGAACSKLAAEADDVTLARRARVAYQRFVTLAPADDPSVPRIRQILENAP